MTKKKDFELTSIWQEIVKMSADIADELPEDPDYSLERKLWWFFFNGPVGVLFAIKEIFGESGYKYFINFILNYINTPETKECYYPSPNIKEFVSTNLKMQQKLNLEKTLRAIVSEKEEQMNKGDD